MSQSDLSQLLKQPTGNHSSEGVGRSFTRHLLHWSPTFRLVYLLRTCLVLPCAVARRLPGSCYRLGMSGDGGIGEDSGGGELALRSYTCLPPSPLKTEHLTGSPQGWVGRFHSNRCFTLPCLAPPSSSGEPPPSGSVLGEAGPMALATPSTPAEPGHIPGPSWGPLCAPGAWAPMAPPGRQPGTPTKTAP